MKNGYTLVEIIIAIAILGILATLAIPRLVGQKEAAVAGEAVNALSALHGAQLRYCMDHNDCASNTYPTACDDLDIGIPSLKNFGVPVCSNNGNISVARSGGATYTVIVDKSGVYTCPLCTAYVLKTLPQ